MTEQQASKLIENQTNTKIINIKTILNRGLVNQIYSIETSEAKFILRTDICENDISRFQKEKWCAEAANNVGVFCPKVIKIGMLNQHPYMIMEYIDGITGDESVETNTIWKMLGCYTQKIHSIPVTGYGEHMMSAGVFKDNWSQFLDYNIKNLHLKDKTIELGIITAAQSEKLKKIFLVLREKNFKFGLTHYDVSLKNTIITSVGKVYLLDWGSALVAPIPHLDFAEILVASIDETSESFSTFLDGYGMTLENFNKIKLEIAQVDLLIYMDKLRWAIDRNKDKIDYFSKEVKTRIDRI